LSWPPRVFPLLSLLIPRANLSTIPIFFVSGLGRCMFFHFGTPTAFSFLFHELPTRCAFILRFGFPFSDISPFKTP